MISKKDCEILSHLRNNARRKITHISKQTEIPVTTIYDKVRVHERKFIKKHTALLDFTKLGFLSNAHIAIKVERDSREALQKFLLESININSLYRTNFGTDFLAEAIFKNSAEMQNFKEQLEDQFKINEINIFNTIEELKKEDFLTKKEHFDLI
ncbi:MAG: Lrp/AsnC family transcriptional regulator [Nanoarchaeota archaeon]|nr:Lrp/AsnC family transcriptional regulator [Nanoarchaeota archaeon]